MKGEGKERDADDDVIVMTTEQDGVKDLRTEKLCQFVLL